MPCNNKLQPPPWPCFGVRHCGGLIFFWRLDVIYFVKNKSVQIQPFGEKDVSFESTTKSKNKPMFKNISSCRALAPSLSFPDSCINMFFNMPTMNVLSTWSMALASQFWWFRISARAKRSCYTPLLNHHKTTNKFAQLVFARPVQKLSITSVLARQTCKNFRAVGLPL